MKVDVTTTCLNCKKSFIRKMFLEEIIAGCVLDICPNCETDNQILIGKTC